MTGEGLLTAMAVGAYIYVGKSRLRKKGREKRRARQEASRKKSPPPSGGSPRSDDIRYSPLLSSDGDEISLRECDVAEDDACSTGSSESEDLLPLILFDLDLRPHIEKSPTKNKMPFELFKKKDKKKDVAKKEVPTPEPEVKETLVEEPKVEVKEEEIKGEVNETLQDVSLDEAITDTTKEEIKEELKEGTKEETDEGDTEPITEQKTKIEEDSVSLADSGVDLQANPVEVPKEKTVQKLPLEKISVADKEDERFGVVCCTIL